MTLERDDRILSAVAEMGPCTIRMVCDRFGVECTELEYFKIRRAFCRLEGFRFLTSSMQGRIRVYALWGVEPRMDPPPSPAPRRPRWEESKNNANVMRGVTVRRRLLSIVAEMGPCRTLDLAQESGMNHHVLLKHLNIMKGQGLICSDGRNRIGGRMWWLSGETSPTDTSCRHTKGYGDIDAVIRGALHGGGCMTVPDMVQATGLNHMAIRRHIEAMEADGTVIRWGMRGDAVEWRLVAGRDAE